MIACAIAACDASHSNDPRLEAGWVTNCAGPAFSKFGGSSPGPDRPVFRVTDKLVLAVPKEFRPVSGRIDREPSKCAQISDLPRNVLLEFILQGDWSAGSSLADIPTVSGNLKMFRPDRVWVRIEKDIRPRISPEEEREFDEIDAAYARDTYIGQRDIAGLTCPISKHVGELSHCSGKRNPSDLDVVKLRYNDHSASSFILIQSDYVSSRFGGILVYWQAWTSDVSHWRDIEDAIWKHVAEWNLLSTGRAQWRQTDTPDWLSQLEEGDPTEVQSAAAAREICPRPSVANQC